jgi:hypothetical protein
VNRHRGRCRGRPGAATGDCNADNPGNQTNLARRRPDKLVNESSSSISRESRLGQYCMKLVLDAFSDLLLAWDALFACDTNQRQQDGLARRS